jgi:hypothetical protein
MLLDDRRHLLLLCFWVHYDTSDVDGHLMMWRRLLSLTKKPIGSSSIALLIIVVLLCTNDLSFRLCHQKMLLATCTRWSKHDAMDHVEALMESMWQWRSVHIASNSIILGLSCHTQQGHTMLQWTTDAVFLAPLQGIQAGGMTRLLCWSIVLLFVFLLIHG